MILVAVVLETYGLEGVENRLVGLYYDPGVTTSLHVDLLVYCCLSKRPRVALSTPIVDNITKRISYLWLTEA